MSRARQRELRAPRGRERGPSRLKKRKKNSPPPLLLLSQNPTSTETPLSFSSFVELSPTMPRPQRPRRRRCWSSCLLTILVALFMSIAHLGRSNAGVERALAAREKCFGGILDGRRRRPGISLLSFFVGASKEAAPRSSAWRDLQAPTCPPMLSSRRISSVACV